MNGGDMKYEMTDNSPNQTFRIIDENIPYDFVIRTFKGRAYVSVLAEDEYIVTSMLIISGAPILPKRYARAAGGNFVFRDIEKDVVTTDRFDGISCTLYFEEE